MILLAEHAIHPRTYGFQTAQPLRRVHGWVPDAVTDTTAKRTRKAAALLGEGAGVLPRLWTLPGHDLFHVVLTLPSPMDFYTQAPAAGRAEMDRLFPQAPTLAQVAYGRSGHIHIHAAVALPEGTRPPAAGTFGRLHAVPVTTASQLTRLACYFSRPADERAARPNRQATLLYTKRELQRQRLDAAEMYLETRSRVSRLPRTRWRRNIPRDLWETAPQPVRAPRQPKPWTPRVPHVILLPHRPTSQKRGPLPCPTLGVTLPQTKHLPVLPQARSPPGIGGERGLTIPLPRYETRLPNGPPPPTRHLGHDGATLGAHLLNTLRAFILTRYDPLPPGPLSGGRGVRTPHWPGPQRDWP